MQNSEIVVLDVRELIYDCDFHFMSLIKVNDNNVRYGNSMTMGSAC